MVLKRTGKLTKIQRQMLDEQIKYLQTILIAIGNHSIGSMAPLSIQSQPSRY